jgi:regulator of sigma E protease
VHKKYGFFEALPAGFNGAVKTIVDYVKQFRLIFTPSTGAYKQVGGFGGMAKMFAPTWNWEHFWRLTGILSLVLAFMNFLPIPMLDGGYMMFILWEMITGKPPGEKFMTVANNIGFIIVMALLLYANGNDIFKAIFGG